jgi:hypothetical protein
MSPGHCVPEWADQTTSETQPSGNAERLNHADPGMKAKASYSGAGKLILARPAWERSDRPPVIGIHYPPGLEVANDLPDPVTDLVDLGVIMPSR